MKYTVYIIVLFVLYILHPVTLLYGTEFDLGENSNFYPRSNEVLGHLMTGCSQKHVTTSIATDTYFTANNVGHNVKTLDGNQTFHGMGIALMSVGSHATNNLEIPVKCLPQIKVANLKKGSRNSDCAGNVIGSEIGYSINSKF